MIKAITGLKIEELRPVVVDYAKIKNNDEKWTNQMLVRLQAFVSEGPFTLIGQFSDKTATGLALTRTGGKINLFHVISGPSKESNEIELMSYVLESFKQESSINYEGGASQHLQSFLLSQGFRQFVRHDLMLDLKKFELSPTSLAKPFQLIPWNETMKSEVIDLIVTVNGESIDGHIFPEFQTRVGCENFVGNLVEGGFGKFMANHSLFLINKERVICFCFVTEHNDTVGFIPIMGLLPDFRGKGLGKSILLSVISKMKMESPQFEKLGLTVTEENHHAYSMYKKYGFKHLETNHAYTKTI